MQKVVFNNDWIFYKENSEKREQITLPHDAMLYESRSKDAASGAAGAYFEGGVYHYDKTFFVPEEWKEKTGLLFLEGAYQKTTVKLNGQVIGGCVYGYRAFEVSLEDWEVGAENTIEVIVENDMLPNSRWYSGSGIYRPVNLLIGDKEAYIKHQGIKITTLSIAPAKVLVETEHVGGEAAVRILKDKKEVAAGKGEHLEFEIPDAKLWSDSSPELYTCEVSLIHDGEVVEQAVENFGIREITYSSQGLFINGKSTLLRGGCVHHDNGILGAKCIKEAEWRKVKRLKEAGYNAIRSSHNPCSVEMLHACDHYGMYMIDETWDMWYGHKNKYDYASEFMDNYQYDLISMVKKDYNHPSVIAYSIGNEVAEPATEKGLAIEKDILDTLHKLDAKRPVTGGFNMMIMSMAAGGNAIYKEEGGREESTPAVMNNSLIFNVITTFTGPGMNQMANSKKIDKLTTECMDALDIAGYNYASGRYKKEGKCHPDRLIYGSETFPGDIVKNWRSIEKYPYLIGDFMWTAWDYLGEAGSGAWAYSKDGQGFEKPFPWLLADMGVLDILGNPNGELFLAQAVWKQLEKPVISVQPVNHPGIRPAKSAWRCTNSLPSWSWENCKGNKAVVEVYFDAARAELFCNGKKIGSKKIKNCKASFSTIYEPGVLEAIVYDANGKEAGRSKLESAAGKKTVAISCEQSEIHAEDVIFLPITICGENGIVESNADTTLSIQVEGGELLGFGSANPRTLESFVSGTYTTYYGNVQAVVRVGQTDVLKVRVTDGATEYQKSFEIVK